MTTVAHEWGHHIQNILGIVDADLVLVQIELQADCMAGMFARHAQTRGILEPGDVDEGVELMAAVADPAWYPNTAPGAHGDGQQRTQWFLRGYNSSDFTACRTY